MCPAQSGRAGSGTQYCCHAARPSFNVAEEGNFRARMARGRLAPSHAIATRLLRHTVMQRDGNVNSYRLSNHYTCIIIQIALPLQFNNLTVIYILNRGQNASWFFTRARHKSSETFSMQLYTWYLLFLLNSFFMLTMLPIPTLPLTVPASLLPSRFDGSPAAWTIIIILDDIFLLQKPTKNQRNTVNALNMLLSTEDCCIGCRSRTKLAFFEELAYTASAHHQWTGVF